MTEIRCQMLRQLVAREEDCGKPAVARTMISGHPFYVCAEHVLPGDLRLRELP